MLNIRLLPIYGIILFSTLYFYASLLYPGGTSMDPQSVGFSWMGNYWCDLVDIQSYSQQPNPARPVAILSMLILAVFLSHFWILVTKSFPGRHSKWMIGLFGPLAMLASVFVFTPYHDLLIYVGAPLGLIAFGASIYKIRHLPFGFWLSLIPAGFVVLNFSLWHFHAWIDWLPLIQKLAFASFFTWVIYLTRQMQNIAKNELSSN